MHILLDNLSWMNFNIGLGAVAVVCGMLMYKVSSWQSKLVFGIVWLLFLPNTMYIFTDLMHLPGQFVRIQAGLRPLLILEYVGLMVGGVITYLASIYPFAKMIRKSKFVKQFGIVLPLFAINYVAAVGVVLGRVYRFNSWDILTQSHKILEQTAVAFSTLELLLFTVVFAVVMQLLYQVFAIYFPVKVS